MGPLDRPKLEIQEQSPDDFRHLIEGFFVGDCGFKVPVPSVLVEYLHGGFETHLHMWAGFGEGDMRQLCAVLLQPIQDLDVAWNRWVDCDAGVVGECRHQGDDPVFVLVPGVLEGPQVGVFGLGVVVRLQSLDVCVDGRRHSANLRFPFRVEGDLIREDRESRSFHRLSLVGDGELVDGMVECGSHVVDGFTEQDTPENVGGFHDSELQRVLGGIRVELSEGKHGLTLPVGVGQVFDVVELMLCPRKFESDPPNRIRFDSATTLTAHG